MTLSRKEKMAKFTDVKVGDIVSYDGHVARVMEKTNITMETLYPLIRIIGPTIDSRLHPTDVQLVKSIKLPQLKIGDRIHVDDVPEHERCLGGSVWLSDMIDFINKEYIVQDLWDHPRFGPVAKLGDWWFRTYHLSSISQYDIV